MIANRYSHLTAHCSCLQPRLSKVSALSLEGPIRDSKSSTWSCKSLTLDAADLVQLAHLPLPSLQTLDVSKHISFKLLPGSAACMQAMLQACTQLAKVPELKIKPQLRITPVPSAAAPATGGSDDWSSRWEAVHTFHDLQAAWAAWQKGGLHALTWHFMSREPNFHSPLPKPEQQKGACMKTTNPDRSSHASMTVRAYPGRVFHRTKATINKGPSFVGAAGAYTPWMFGLSSAGRRNGPVFKGSAVVAKGCAQPHVQALAQPKMERQVLAPVQPQAQACAQPGMLSAAGAATVQED